ncbi:MAG: Gfo/Idh/MocA family oxidoreductase [Bryobacteraceae bacterium]|nr:Gfo/Idh/MocA family oxidoreductase [Bryobacteraceae bacterium]
MTRVAVVGVGNFGKNHLRVVKESDRATLAGLVDIDQARALTAASEYDCRVFPTLESLRGAVDAAIVATPTNTHAEVGCALLSTGIDVLVEKPIAGDMEGARGLQEAAAGRILMVGHLERFNPAILALRKIITTPLFFEIHRMSAFSPRSLDVDVVLDLMVHDIDLVLDFTGAMPEEIRAAGVRILSDKVDIANARLAFPNGCIANLTASRVSTEKIRKMRLFQPHQYISVDYSRQEGMAISVGENRQIGFQPLASDKREPLKAQFDAFLDAVETRAKPAIGAPEAARTLEVSLDILGKIEAHARIVAETLGLG